MKQVIGSCNGGGRKFSFRAPVRMVGVTTVRYVN